jgi:hypothetical protein
MMKAEYTQEQALAKMRSGKNIFLTGLPGTGKSYIIRQFIEEKQNEGKQILVCAPTGIAALNVGGVTMHQAFSIPIPAYGHYITEITNSKVKAALTADIIIIDEISMCRNDVFEYFGYVIDYINKEGRDPQIIVIGDMFQLPPVVPETEIAKLKRYGFDLSGYCFTSRYWKKLKFTPVVLTKIFRQQDEEFINNLGMLRLGSTDCIAYFNDRVKDIENRNSPIIQICSTNATAQEINDAELSKLNSPMCLYKMQKEKFCPKETAAEESLILKEGARVMFIANDVISKQYTNGEFGTITLCLDNYVRVLKDDGNEITVFPYKWTVYDIKTSGSEISKKEVGNYTQLPLKLAYCITMHKTQGQTYDKAIVTPSSFACGQLYVALSRVRSVDGIFLTQPITEQDIKANQMVCSFYDAFNYDVPDKEIEKRKKLDKAAADKKKKKKSRGKRSSENQSRKASKPKVKGKSKAVSKKKPSRSKTSTSNNKSSGKKKRVITKRKPQ